jgi:hypothetical protein
MTANRRSLALFLALAVASVSAQAAELPNKRAAPANDHVKKCNVGGMEGTVVAGTTICVKIGGYVSGGVEAGNLKSSVK